MAAINPGVGGTFKAETAEGRLIECLCFLQQQESISAQNPNQKNAVQGSFDIEEAAFSGAYVIPAELSISDDGSLAVVAAPYLQGGSQINPGTGATFKSVWIERYCLEVLMHVQNLERNTAKNPQGRNGVTGSFNSDTGVYAGTFSVPVVISLESTGRVAFVAQEYLLS
jgi:hypothetical protein